MLLVAPATTTTAAAATGFAAAEINDDGESNDGGDGGDHEESGEPRSGVAQQQISSFTGARVLRKTGVDQHGARWTVGGGEDAIERA